MVSDLLLNDGATARSTLRIKKRKENGVNPLCSECAEIFFPPPAVCILMQKHFKSPLGSITERRVLRKQFHFAHVQCEMFFISPPQVPFSPPMT